MENEVILSDHLLTKTVVSLVFLLGAVALRLLLTRWIAHRSNLSAEQRRRWLINSRNSLIFILLVGLVFIWVNELRTLVVSLVALAVAIVVATKELILCFSGSVLRRATDAYGLGDRIDVAGVRGEVVDISFFGTSVREIGPGKGGQQYTGRAVTVPHSLLLNNAVVNESFSGAFQLHLFAVPWKVEEDWQRAERLLLEAAREESAPYLEQARSHMKRLEDRDLIEPPSLEARVSLELPEPGRVTFLVRVPVPANRLSRIEQGILRRFLEAFYSRREEPSAPPAEVMTAAPAELP